MIVKENAKTFLNKFFKADHKSRAFLVAGDGAELDNFADLLAKYILCESKLNCGSCGACNLSINPDFYRASDADLKIDEAREMVSDSSHSSWRGTKLFFFRIGASAADVQTTILKTLEDAHENVFFILRAASEDSLIAPLLSRLIALRLPILKNEADKKYLDLLSGRRLKDKLDRIALISKNRDGTAEFLRAYEFYLEDMTGRLFEKNPSNASRQLEDFFDVKKRYLQKTYFNRMLLEHLIISSSYLR